LVAAVSDVVTIQVAMDSAAVDNVIDPASLPQNADIAPNTTGKHCRGANNAHIETYGTTSTILESADNRVSCDWAVSDVNQALHSVAKVAGPPKVPGKQDILFDNDRVHRGRPLIAPLLALLRTTGARGLGPCARTTTHFDVSISSLRD
jgi:hypothetical protein